MKKYSVLLAVAAVSLFAFAACNKNGGEGGGGGSEVVMKDGTTKAAAKVVKFSSNLPKFEDQKGTYEIRKMEFTEDGKCVIEAKVLSTKANVGDIINKVYSFSESGGTINVSGFGTVSVSGSSVNVNPSAGEGGTFEATVTPTSTSSTTANNFARTWRVNSVVVGVSGKDVSIMKSFSGCNLEEIGKYAAENGVSALKNRLDELKGYNVDNVIFTGANSFVISFTGADAIAGTFSISGSNKLGYNLPANNPFFHGSGSGEFEFPADKKAVVSLNATVEGYSGSIELSLSAAN